MAAHFSTRRKTGRDGLWLVAIGTAVLCVVMHLPKQEDQLLFQTRERVWDKRQHAIRCPASCGDESWRFSDLCHLTFWKPTADKH